MYPRQAEWTPVFINLPRSTTATLNTGSQNVWETGKKVSQKNVCSNWICYLQMWSDSLWKTAYLNLHPPLCRGSAKVAQITRIRTIILKISRSSMLSRSLQFEISFQVFDGQVIYEFLISASWLHNCGCLQYPGRLWMKWNLGRTYHFFMVIKRYIALQLQQSAQTGTRRQDDRLQVKRLSHYSSRQDINIWLDVTTSWYCTYPLQSCVVTER